MTQAKLSDPLTPPSSLAAERTFKAEATATLAGREEAAFREGPGAELDALVEIEELPELAARIDDALALKARWAARAADYLHRRGRGGEVPGLVEEFRTLDASHRDSLEAFQKAALRQARHHARGGR